MDAFGERELPLQVAVMGCVVNGPGEAREADLGIAAGNKRGHLFVKGRNVAVVPEDEMVEALVEWAEFINEHGTDAAIARADTARAEREAAARPLGAAGGPGRRRQPRRREDRRDPQDRGHLTPGSVVWYRPDPADCQTTEGRWWLCQRRHRVPAASRFYRRVTDGLREG